MPEQTVSFGLRIPKSLSELLDRVSEATGRPRNEIVVGAVNAYLNGAPGLRAWRTVAAEAWREAHQAVKGELEVAESALQALKGRLEELEKRQAELEEKKEEALAVLLEGHKTLDPDAVAQARQRIAEIESELRALAEISDEGQARLNALQQERDELLRKRSDVFRRIYEGRLLSLLKTETERVALLLEGFFADVLESLNVTRDLSAQNGYRWALRWLNLYALSQIFDTTGNQQLRRAIKSDLPFSREFSNFGHIEQLIRNQLRPKLVVEAPTSDERAPELEVSGPTG